MRKASVTEVDKNWSWVIAFSCCFINCLLYGVARLSGLMMVAVLETFQVSRASAALPFSISTSVRNLSGIFVGYLGQRFGLRVTIATGCLLASIGAGVCFFISDVVWITVCWGGIFGTGFGLATSLLPLAINQNFEKHRGIASGISYSGSYIGSFVFPPFLVVLLDKYGLSGAFIVISAVFLNGLAVAMLFRNPRKISQAIRSEIKTIYTEKCTENDSSNFNTTPTENRFRKMWYQLLHKIKSNTNMLNHKDATNPQDLNGNQISANTLRYKSSKKYMGNCELVSYADLSLNDQSDSSLGFVSDYMVDDPKLTFMNPILKRKQKIKLKKNLSKIGKKFITPAMRKEHSMLNQFSYFPLEDVKLISFRNLYCVFCSDAVPRKNTTAEFLWSASRNDRLVLDNLYYRTKIQDNVPIANECSNSLKELSNYEIVTKCNFSDFINQNKVLELSSSQLYQVNQTDSFTDSITNCYQNHLLCQPNFLSNIEQIETHNKSRNTARYFWLKDACKCFFGWFRLYSEPMFVVIAVTMSLQTFVIVCLITIIEDFAKDIGIPEYHYVLMVLSISDLVGSLTLGVITDRKILSRCHFIVLCFLGMSACIVSISMSRSFTTLLTLVAIYGIFESGVIITFPLLIAHFIPSKKQTVAIASSNILSSPTVLLVPLVIGYFRDEIGCYSGVFYCLATTALCCSIIWLITPYIFTKHKRKWKPQAAMNNF